MLQARTRARPSSTVKKEQADEVRSSHALNRATRQLLRKYAAHPPSLTLHLYPTHFRFEHQPGLFLRNSPAWSFLSCLRDQRLPEDLRDVLQVPRRDPSTAQIPFYEGCLIVELHDHRQSHNTQSDAATTDAQPPRYPVRHLDTEFYADANKVSAAAQSESHSNICRIVLWPQEGALAAETTRLLPKDPQSALAVEGRILALTQPDLCLSPDPAVCQVAHVSWMTTMPPPVKMDSQRQKRQLDRESTDDAREKRMRTMDESYGRSFAPTFSRLDLIQSIKRDREKEQSGQSPASTPVPAPAQPPAQQQPQTRPQHPLAQTHYPPQPQNQTQPSSSASSSSRNNSNLSLTIPPRKSNANSPVAQQPPPPPQPLSSSTTTTTAAAAAALTSAAAGPGGGPKKKTKAKNAGNNAKAKSQRAASAAQSPPNASESPGWNLPGPA